MKTIMAASVIALLVGGGVAEAKKKAPPTAGEVKKPEKDERKKGPGDKGTNEGAQGRQNATEDASKAGQHPSFDRRP
jgi:hypothetical protein